MGDFVVYRQNKTSKQQHDAMLTTLSRQGSQKPHIIKDDSYNILIFPKSLSPVQNFIENKNGDYCCSSGCFFYKGQNGTQALDLFLQDFNPEKYTSLKFIGIFTLIIKKQNRLFIISDPLGASRIFHNLDQTLWSSSFLAMAENINILSPDTQGIYEYIFQETNYGSTTPFNEIKLADSLCYFELKPDGIQKHQKNVPVGFELSSSSFDELIEEHSSLLKNQMHAVISSYGTKVSTALSGGYDSRLMLSLLKNENVSPDIYVYGSDDSSA